MNANELYHHGVKGMKWGVRKKRYNDASTSSSRKGEKKTGKVPIDKVKLLKTGKIACTAALATLATVAVVNVTKEVVDLGRTAAKIPKTLFEGLSDAHHAI